MIRLKRALVVVALVHYLISLEPLDYYFCGVYMDSCFPTFGFYIFGIRTANTVPIALLQALVVVTLFGAASYRFACWFVPSCQVLKNE